MCDTPKKPAIINFDKIAEVANKLIDKISDATGWIVSHDTPKRIATATFIQGVQDSNYDPLTKAALISNAKKCIKDFCNQNDIVNIALQAIKPDAKIEKVNDDWLAQFMDKARLVSDLEFQILWGNILAEECNEPGSIPKALLHIMEHMEKESAMAFMNIAALSVSSFDSGGTRAYPVIRFTGEARETIFGEITLETEQVENLSSIGLIWTNYERYPNSYGAEFYTPPIVVNYFDKHYQFPEHITQIPTGNIAFTRAGEALCKAVKPREVPNFLEGYCIPFWKKELNLR